MSKKITTHCQLDVYGKAFDAATQVFELSKAFPKEEIYSLTDQIRRSSRSVCANLAEAWRKRRYEKAFVSKLSDAEAEAVETQVWLEFAFKCDYLSRNDTKSLYRAYDEVLRMIVSMINNAELWLLKEDDRIVHEEAEEYNELFYLLVSSSPCLNNVF